VASAVLQKHLPQGLTEHLNLTLTLNAAPARPMYSCPRGQQPMFLSAGNADPLGPQSVQLAERAAALGIRTDTLFFPADHAPLLGHEYQFDLDIADGRTALDRASAFLNRVFTLP
jgi:acetyl esterase/lipase